MKKKRKRRDLNGNHSHPKVLHRLYCDYISIFSPFIFSSLSLFFLRNFEEKESRDRKRERGNGRKILSLEYINRLVVSEYFLSTHFVSRQTKRVHLKSFREKERKIRRKEKEERKNRREIPFVLLIQREMKTEGRVTV